MKQKLQNHQWLVPYFIFSCCSGFVLSLIWTKWLTWQYFLLSLIFSILTLFACYHGKIKYDDFSYRNYLRKLLIQGQYEKIIKEFSNHVEKQNQYFEYYLLSLFQKGNLHQFRKIYTNHMNDIHVANTLERYILCVFYDLMEAVQSNKKPIRFLRNNDQNYPYQKHAIYSIFQNISFGLHSYFENDVEKTKQSFDLFMIQYPQDSPVLKFHLHFLMAFLMYKQNHSKFKVYLNYAKQSVYDKFSIKLLNSVFKDHIQCKEVKNMEKELSRTRRNQQNSNQNNLNDNYAYNNMYQTNAIQRPQNQLISSSNINNVERNQNQDLFRNDLQSPTSSNHLDSTWFMRQSQMQQESYPQNPLENKIETPQFAYNRQNPNLNNTQSNFSNTMEQNMHSSNFNRTTSTQNMNSMSNMNFSNTNSFQNQENTRSFQRSNPTMNYSQSNNVIMKDDDFLNNSSTNTINMNQNQRFGQTNTINSTMNHNLNKNTNSIYPPPVQDIPDFTGQQNIIHNDDIVKNRPSAMSKNKKKPPNKAVLQIRRYRNYLKTQSLLLIIVSLNSIILSIATSSLVYTSFFEEYAINSSIVQNIVQMALIIALLVTYLTLGAHTGYFIMQDKIKNMSILTKILLSPFLLIIFIVIGALCEIPYLIFTKIKVKEM